MKRVSNVEETCKHMKPGFMLAVLSSVSKTNIYETIFIIKSTNKIVKELGNSKTVDVRAGIEFNENAAGLIYVTRFGNNSKRVYHHWFDINIQREILSTLLTQKSIKYFLVNEKNKITDILLVPNVINEAIIEYFAIANNYKTWADADFNNLVFEEMKKYHTKKQLWDGIGEKIEYEEEVV